MLLKYIFFLAKMTKNVKTKAKKLERPNLEHDNIGKIKLISKLKEKLKDKLEIISAAALFLTLFFVVIIGSTVNLCDDGFRKGSRK